MAFRKPISTFGGLVFWQNQKQNTLFIMQKHKIWPPIWPYRYRIILRENRMEICNSNDINEIEYDWEYLQDHVIPQYDRRIDIYEKITDLKWKEIIQIALAVAKAAA